MFEVGADINSIIKEHFDIIKKCRQPAEHGVAVLATLPEERYPYVYTRDVASTCRMLHDLSKKKEFEDECLKLLEEIGTFILHCQRNDGLWAQRYDTDGDDASIYKQEDNNAHGVIILLNYAFRALETRRKIKHIDEISRAIEKGLNYAVRNYYRQEINLFFSTTSIHETTIEKGYSIWVNFAYLRALNLALKYFNIERNEKQISFLSNLLSYFEQNVYRTFKREAIYIRRFTPEGEMDVRPDITLFSPFYFGFIQPDDKVFAHTVEFIERRLWDPKLGGLQRYLPFLEDLSTHIHAGNGPWMPYTAILAQYHYKRGNIARGDEILKMIDNYKSPEGFIPEHLSTVKRFKEFMRLEWNTGLEYRKEFNPEALLPDLPFNRIVEELNNMKRTYDGIAQHIKRGRDEFIRFAYPLVLSHTEYILALLEREKYQKHHQSP